MKGDGIVVGKNRRGEREWATLGDVLNPEMASKLLQLRNELETKTELTGARQRETTSASRKKQREPVVVIKSRRKPAGPDAWHPHKRTQLAPAKDLKPDPHSAAKFKITNTEDVVDRSVATGCGLFQPLANRREEPKGALPSQRSPALLDARPLPIVVTHNPHPAAGSGTNVSLGKKGEAEARLFDLCLFDLDDTLVRTADMEEIRPKGANNHSEEYKEEVRKAFHSRPRTKFYDDSIISSFKRKFPGLKLGVFTRSPRLYAQVVLGEAFSSPWWNVLITYEDVTQTKPHGDGIHLAMNKLGIEHPSRVLMVGDGSYDIRAAYNAGAIAALDTSSWSRDYVTDNWRSKELIPDMRIERPSDLLSALDAFPRFLPALESALAGFPGATESPRFDKIGKFIPGEIGGDRTAYQIFTCGRSFARYESISKRREYHQLTASIVDNKQSTIFPNEWIVSIFSFIIKKMRGASGLVVSVIPRRPDREPRLESLLLQLKEHVSLNPFPGSDCISFEPELLGYKEGVRSNSNEKLSPVDRFANVRDHLFVKTPQAVVGRKRVLVIDDVCTTGSSLIYAGLYLSAAGSGEVTRLAVSMNIGNVLYD